MLCQYISRLDPLFDFFTHLISAVFANVFQFGCGTPAWSCNLSLCQLINLTFAKVVKLQNDSEFISEFSFVLMQSFRTYLQTVQFHCILLLYESSIKCYPK